ncbi:formyltransferase family protein [Flavobacteriaceae bacterium]|nr:formyltransferase family protein [Flavobacteriaceae bacterium]
MKYALAGDRKISVQILEWLIKKGNMPLALFVSEGKNETHSNELIGLVQNLDCKVYRGNDINELEAQEELTKYNLDYIIGVHYPFIISKRTIDIPRVGFLNLHPAYLPYNKGWHTPSWSILDSNIYGATLHFMTEKLDKGDIINQEELNVDICDTADSLYKKVLRLEFKVFKDAYEDLINLSPRRLKQSNQGTSHKKAELNTVARIGLFEQYSFFEIYNKLRGLTTNNINEAAFFEHNERKFRIQIIIKEEK